MDRVQLAAALRAYTTPDAFPELFRHNLSVVGAVAERPAVRALVDALAAAGRLDADDVLIDLQRWLLVAHEYYPGQLRVRRGFAAAGLAGLAAIAAAGLARARGGEPAAVLVDDWDPGSAETFYGADVVAALGQGGRVALADVTAFRDVDVRDLARLAPRWPRLAAAARRAEREEGVGFSRYLVRVAALVLAGRTLRRRYGARVVLSGNDNGFPTLKARAAGMRVVLAQNGLRGLLSDSAFVSADVLLAMGSAPLQEVRVETGCRFGEVRELGSLRLARHIAARGAAPEPAYDVVFVSSLEPAAPFDARHGHYYPMAAEHRAIRLVGALAESTGLRVAHYPRMDDERARLEAEGLLSPAVELLERRPGGVYAAAEAGHVVLSSVSTATLEALALGRPAGFVNLSGNAGILAPFARAGLEHTGEDPQQLARFVEHLRSGAAIGLVTQPSEPVRVVAEAVLADA